LAKEDIPYMEPPRKTLRKKIGPVPLSQIFTASKIEHCQRMVDRAYKDMQKEIQKQIIALAVEVTYANAHPEQKEYVLRKISELSYDIKKRLESLGFPFGFSVAESLYDYTRGMTDYTENKLLAVQKHIDVLKVILKDEMKQQTDEMDKEMLACLRKLVKKVKTPLPQE